MTILTRRHFVTGVVATGAASLVSQADGAAVVEQTKHRPSTLAEPQYNKTEVEKLSAYFASVAPKLLRPAGGVLRHPSISPSLPGKAYSTELWDWDTYWTAMGLFRLAKARGDKELHRDVAEHAQGSLFNFFDHQSSEGRIPIMIEVNNPDPFGCLRHQVPGTNNQAKPVMGQLALLIADELGDATWLGPYLHTYSASTTRGCWGIRQAWACWCGETTSPSATIMTRPLSGVLSSPPPT